MGGDHCLPVAIRRSAWLFLVLISGSVACNRSDSSRVELIRPVKTIVVSVGDDTRVRSFPGKVQAARKAELAFQVSGLLAKMPVKEGQVARLKNLFPEAEVAEAMETWHQYHPANHATK